MDGRSIGVAAMGTDAKETLSRIRDLEKRGIAAAWLTTPSAGGVDALTVYAAAAVQTERIKLGTSIVPTWPRHPITAVQQALIIANLAPGRFRLGVGPSHKPAMEGIYGFDFKAPLTNLREYIYIAKTLLREGAVDFDGKHYHAHARSTMKVSDVPVLASALQPRSYELCGEVADGAISWVCPHAYLVGTALPAMKAAAAKAKRPAPPLIAHTPICVTDDVREAHEAAAQQLANYPKMPFYASMLATAGFPEVHQTKAWSGAMLDSVMITGSEKVVASKLESLLNQGIGEVLAHVITAGGPDAAKSRERTLSLLGGLAKQ